MMIQMGAWMDLRMMGFGFVAVLVLAVVTVPAQGQTPGQTTDTSEDMAGMDHDMAGMDMGHDMSGMDHGMSGLLGNYPMTRESSGTSWQPQNSPMSGAMFMAGGWTLMTEGNVTLIHDHQGGERGDTQTFSTSMAMLMASRNVTEKDRLGLRAMISLDPAMGPRGYPLLFATGETADGRTPLIDRQHPHDLFMELAASWMHELSAGTALSLYAGLPGEPALGPPAFMHRISGMDNPEAPVGHHWFDSTHNTYGVVTAGLSVGTWKIEASTFRGREPDEHRWDIESPRLDSWSVRASWNPVDALSMQVSTGHLHSPEALEPDADEQRTTASVTWNVPLGNGRTWASTLGWSSKNINPGPALAGYLFETALRAGGHELYARVEREQEDELLENTGLQSAVSAIAPVFNVSKVSIGYQHEWVIRDHLVFAMGAVADAYAYPGSLKPFYGREGFKSTMIYGRLHFGQALTR